MPRRRALAALFDAHHYSNGWPSCAGHADQQTEDAPSGLDSADPLRAGAASSRRQQFGQPLAIAQRRATLASALGLAATAASLTLGSLPASVHRCLRRAADGGPALWTPTWGYYLANLVGMQGLGVDDLDWAREHFIAHVPPAGPLPFLRAGRQPYGVLPVTILADWAAPAGDEAGTRRTCGSRPGCCSCATGSGGAACPTWRGSGRSSDPQQDLAAVLRGDGVAAAIARVICSARQYLPAPACFPAKTSPARGWNAAHDALHRGRAGAARRRLAAAACRGAHDERELALAAPLVQASAAALERN